MIGALLVAFVSAVVAALAWIFFLRAVSANRRYAATFWDMMLVMLALVTIQIWGDFERNPLIFAARVVGSGVGTFVTMTLGLRK